MKAFLFLILSTYSALSLANTRDSLYAEFEEELVRLENSDYAAQITTELVDEVSTSQAAPQLLNAEDVVIIPLPGMEDDSEFFQKQNGEKKAPNRIKSRD